MMTECLSASTGRAGTTGQPIPWVRGCRLMSFCGPCGVQRQPGDRGRGTHDAALAARGARQCASYMADADSGSTYPEPSTSFSAGLNAALSCRTPKRAARAGIAGQGCAPAREFRVFMTKEKGL